MNPWVTDVDDAEPVVDDVEVESVPLWRPQPGVVSPEHGLGQRGVWSGGMWVMGTHGGAGETTVAGLLDLPEADHCWPVGLAQMQPAVLAVARGSATGLRAASNAARQWAAGGLACVLFGLVVVAPMPGRLPRELRQMRAEVEGAYPCVWDVPWSPDLVCGRPWSPPKVLGHIARQVEAFTTERTR